MNKLAYTTLIAFISSILTLVGAYWLVPSHAQSDSQGRIISLEELAQHNHAASCWKVIDGRVYDITDYIDEHPTPESVLTDWCGMESTEAWYDKGNGRPHSPGALVLLAQFDIGVLAGHEAAAPAVTDIEPQADNLVPETSAPADEVSTQVTRLSIPAMQLADGSYYAESEPSSRGLNAILEMTVKNGQIIGIYFDEIRRNESSSVEYRKSADLEYADRWRQVSGVSQLSAFPALEAQLMQSGSLAEVDAITGATSAYNAFSALASELMGEQQAVAIARVDNQGYRDGSYYAESEPDSRGWRALVEITIVNGRIASVYYDEIQRDDEGVFQARKSDDLNYADRWRRVSQISHLSAFEGYENQLMLTGSIDNVDALTGATSAFESFRRLVHKALAEAH
ncbi:cytochrome b5 domain-containing protein [Nitrincola sp. MINF-07-Sa-05]|uniref:cytochrome b5 domain-containing protein n=1 Tax=Nitrincola salilacus TaxID=3400273 RepID=UPI0039180836